jgi:hypothetical protein
MKRQRPGSDFSGGACSAKRRKTQSGDVGVVIPVSSHQLKSPPPPKSPPPSNLSSQTLALGEVLRSGQQSTSNAPESSIQHWAEDCAAACTSERMAEPPPTPRSAYGNDRGRRSTKRHARSSGSRTPSPSKPSPQTYRTRNMYHAGVYVDKLVDLPPAVDNEVRQILGIEKWGDRVAATVEGPPTAARTQAAATFCAESRKNVRDCLLEGDWKATSNSLLRNLADLSPNVRTQTSEKSKFADYAQELRARCSLYGLVWNPDLKPTAQLFDEVPNEGHRGTRTPGSASSQTALPDFNPSAAATSPVFPGHIPSLPPYTQSIASTTSLDAVNPYYISTPKPDITVGLAHTAFMQSHQRRLVDHQASGSILSDPHAAEMGIRFPFLIVEAKGSSLNGSLISAQNQAAISGVCMLTILQDLNRQATGVQTLDPELTPQSVSPTVCFSIVTEGPVHELWVHFELGGAFYMEFIELWRTTRQRDAREFVHFIAQIMAWGAGKFKDSIVEKLDNVPRHSVATA